jgi:hypothetical protein
LRYVKYFEDVLRKRIICPQARVLKGLEVHTVPHINGKSARPYLEIVQVTKQPAVIYSGKSIPDLRKYKDTGA